MSRWPERDLTDQMENALRRARTFISYARYELVVGRAELGDQFPKTEDADEVIKYIDDVLGDKK